MDKNPSTNAGDMGSILGLGRFHGPQATKACTPQLLSLGSRAHQSWLMRPCATAIEACILEPTGHKYWARVLQPLKPVSLERVLCNKGSPHNEKPVPMCSNEDPVQPKVNNKVKTQFLSHLCLEKSDKLIPSKQDCEGSFPGKLAQYQRKNLKT